MASATFQLKAVDQTAQAFASVQNKLTKMHATAKQVGVGMATFFGFGAVVGGVKRLDAFMSEAETKAKQLGLTAEEIDNLTIATGAADKVVNFLQSTLAKFAGNIASAFAGGGAAAKATEIRISLVSEALDLANQEAANLDEQLQNVGLGQSQAIELDKKRAAQIRANAEAIKGTDPLKYQQEINKAKGIEVGVAQNLFSVNESYLKSTEALGVAESKRYVERSSLTERIIGQESKASSLIGAIQLTEIDNLSGRIKLQDELAETYNKLNPLIAESRQLGNDAGQAIASGFEDAIFSGQKLGEVIRSLALDLARMVFNKTVTAPLAQGISDALFKMGRAEGGPVGAGNAYVVGEKGPELFVPSSSGSIIPNGGGSGGRSGGSSINVTYNIASGVSRSDLAPILEQERKRLKAEIPDMVRRGGSYRAAFA